MSDPSPVPPESKAPWQSKTLCLAVVALATPLVSRAFPAAGDWLRDNADVTCSAIGLLFGALRIVTKGRISLGA